MRFCGRKRTSTRANVCDERASPFSSDLVFVRFFPHPERVPNTAAHLVASIEELTGPVRGAGAGESLAPPRQGAPLRNDVKSAECLRGVEPASFHGGAGTP